MTLEVRGEKFKIDFVSNYVLEQYGKLQDLSEDIVDAAAEQARIDTDNSVDFFEKRKLAKVARDHRNDLAKEIFQLRDAVIKEILESNGITYDQVFWSRKTSKNDINKFLLECVLKDVEKTEEPKKK